MASIEYAQFALVAPVLAWIDIDEPIQIRHAKTRTRFRYKPGDPFATQFVLHFFLSESDAESNETLGMLTAFYPMRSRRSIQKKANPKKHL